MKKDRSRKNALTTVSAFSQISKDLHIGLHLAASHVNMVPHFSLSKMS